MMKISNQITYVYVKGEEKKTSNPKHAEFD